MKDGVGAWRTGYYEVDVIESCSTQISTLEHAIYTTGCARTHKSCIAWTNSAIAIASLDDMVARFGTGADIDCRQGYRLSV